jgi:hypothetical protein
LLSKAFTIKAYQLLKVHMKKQAAIELLGGTPKLAAQAMGYKTPHACYAWADPLPESIADKVRGAAARLKLKPKKPPAPDQQA